MSMFDRSAIIMAFVEGLFVCTFAGILFGFIYVDDAQQTRAQVRCITTTQHTAEECHEALR